MVVSTPPTSGPRRNPAENATPFTPRAKPMFPLRKASVTITTLLVMSSAPPTPCIMRYTNKSPPWNCGSDSPHNSDPAVKMTKPML